VLTTVGTLVIIRVAVVHAPVHQSAGLSHDSPGVAIGLWSNPPARGWPDHEVSRGLARFTSSRREADALIMRC